MPSNNVTGPGSGRWADDVDLVRHSLTGDQGASEALAIRLGCVARGVEKLNRRMGVPLRPDDVSDLAQETLVQIWEKLPTFEGRGRLEAWANRFCFLQFMNFLRMQHRLEGPRRAYLPDLEPRTAPAQTTLLDREVIDRGLRELDPPEARIIRLKHFHEHTFTEIGVILRSAPSTVKSRYYRGIGRLRRLLEPTLAEVADDR